MTASQSARPVVLLHAAAASTAGLGHVRRVCALAHALAGAVTCRVLLDGDEAVAAFVRKLGIDVTLVPASMDATLREVMRSGAAALVVDSYRFTRADLSRAQATVDLLVVVDDSGEFPLPAHVVVNPALRLRAPAGEESSYLLGPDYALLSPEFAAPAAREWPAVVRAAMVTLGAAPPPGLLAALADAARAALPDADVHVVIGHEAPADMPALMRSVDVAVSAGGVTLLELAATATPTIGVALALNQRGNLVGFEEAGAIVFAGAAEDSTCVASVRTMLASLRTDVERRRTLGTRACRLVDGQGAARVAELIGRRLRLPRRTLQGARP
jgi:spore coat polysaccharide biosynthesis predicted glycosyltransferase SpsG